MATRTQPSAAVRHSAIAALRGIGFGRRAFGVCLLPRSALQGACLRGDLPWCSRRHGPPFPLTDRALIRVLRRDLAAGHLDQRFHALPAGDNPPAKKKYAYWTTDRYPDCADEWLHQAERHEGSWWPHCTTWLASYGGEMVGARQSGSDEFPPLADAPGQYVLEK